MIDGEYLAERDSALTTQVPQRIANLVFSHGLSVSRSGEVPLTRRALITGITGQDGSYLAEHLLEQGYEVWGLVRGQANPHVARLRKHIGDVQITTGDLLDQGSLISAV